MTATIRHNAEGGAHGESVTLSNSGGLSGDVILSTYSGTGATVQYSHLVKRGTLSYEFKTGAVAAEAYMIVQEMPTLDTVYLRFAVYMPSSMSGVSMRFLQILDSASNTCFACGVRTDGLIALRDTAQTVMANSAVKMKFNQWMRFECKVVSGVTTGQTELKIFTEVDSPYPAETIVTAASFNTRPNNLPFGRYRLGMVANFLVSNGALYMDDIMVSSDPLAGPVDGTQPAPLLLQQGAESGANGVTLTPLLSGSASEHFFDSITEGGITYSNAQAAHGNLSLKIDTTSGTETTAYWKLLSTSSLAFRTYGYFTSLPAEATEFANIIADPYVNFKAAARFALLPDGRVRVHQHVDTVPGIIWTSTATISLNTWYRFELYASLGATEASGTIQAAYYLLDDTTAIESFFTSSAYLGLANFGACRFGKINTNGWVTTLYVDDIAVQQQASGFIGPYSSPPSVPSAWPGIIPHIGWGREI